MRATEKLSCWRIYIIPRSLFRHSMADGCFIWCTLVAGRNVLSGIIDPWE